MPSRAPSERLARARACETSQRSRFEATGGLSRKYGREARQERLSGTVPSMRLRISLVGGSNRRGTQMKVLVTVASKHGSTAEIASVIADVLRAADVDADVIAPESVTSLVGYDAVVLGSGVYAGHWMMPARAFVERHEQALRTRPVFLFSSGPIGDPPRPLEDPAEIAAIDEATMALDHRVFAGRLTESDLSPGERLIINMVRAPFGDFRSWDDVSDWARAIAAFVQPELT